MDALVVEPGVAHSARVERVSPPREDGVRVRVLEIGICGTDREISEGLFGAAPDGEATLVLGHELLGRVDDDGHGFFRGDLVTATVRRSCGRCVACAEGSPDACLTGNYSERGITRLHGFAREAVVEDPVQLIPVPRELGRLGVLAEPASVCARAIRHARAIGGRQPWRLERALVIGGGAVGMLATIFLRLAGIDVTTASLEPANAVADRVGARYVSTAATPLAELGRFDLVLEAAGNAQAMAATLGLLRRGGVACLLGIDPRRQQVAVDGQTLGVDTILENRVLFGSVNAHRQDYLAAVTDLTRARTAWPGALDLLVALRVPLDRFPDAFAHRGGKATLVLDEL